VQWDLAGTAYLAAGVAFGVIAAASWHRRASSPRVAGFLTLAMVAALCWSLAAAVSVLATSPALGLAARLAVVPGVAATIAFFVALSLSVALPQRGPSRRVVAALLIEPVLISVAAATNTWHHLVVRGPGAAGVTGLNAWTFGPVYWLHTWFCYASVLAAVVLIAYGWWRASPGSRAQYLAMLAGALVPLGANAVFLAGGFGSVADPTLLGFAGTGVIMAYAIFRQDLFTFTPVARALIVDQIGDAIVAVSSAGRVLDLNPAAVDIVRGINPDAPVDLIGRPSDEVFAGFRPDRTSADGRWTEVSARLAGGRVEFHLRAFPLVDRRGHALGRIFVARDVTAANAQARRLTAANARLVRQLETIERLRSDLVELASRDPLTGLHNRRYLVDRFGPLLASAELSGEPLTVILIDVDRFKDVNDRYGHLIGDEVLISLAHRIREHAPPGALVARWGGEEFFLALPGADAATGVAVAEALRGRCERDGIAVAGPTISCTLSIGVASYPTSGTTMNDLFHAADTTLYEAKNSGRNTVKLHAGSAAR